MNGTYHKVKKLVYIFIPTLITIVLLCIGFSSGYYFVTRPTKKIISEYLKSQTLGRLKDDGVRELIDCYDENVALSDFSSFSWVPPAALTPFVGIGPVPGNHDNAVINNLQMRSESEVLIPKQRNVYRIFITGGSTAYGSGASDQKKTIGGFLSEILNKEVSSFKGTKFEVFTLAYPAWASTHERIAIENRLSELDPDMVISFSGNNDVHWSWLGEDLLWFKTYSDRYFSNLVNEAYRITGYGPVENPASRHSAVHPQKVVDRLIKNIRLSSFVLSSGKTKYVFILQPTLAVTKKKLTGRENKVLFARNQEQRQYFNICYGYVRLNLAKLQIANFTFIDQSTVFDDYDDKKEIFLDSYHFGDKGNRIIAQKIRKDILPLLEK